MVAVETLKGTTRAAVRAGLSLDPVRTVAEHLTRSLGRRWPDAHLVAALMFYIVDALGSKADTQRRVAQLPAGAQLVITLRDYALRELYFKGSQSLKRGWLYEPETTRYVMRWLRPGDTFIDIGANAGYYSALAAVLVGASGAVHAFEPNPTVAPLLRETLASSRVRSRTRANALAVTSTGVPVRIYRSTDPAATGGTTTVFRPEGGTLLGLEVPATTLDRYVELNGIGTIRLVKIDVEGGELDVLGGATRTLREVRPHAILCEFCPEILSDPPATWDSLLGRTRSFGYIPHLVAADGTSVISDGSMPTWQVGNVCFLRNE